MTNSTGTIRSLRYYTIFGFLVIGVITVLLGQILPILSTRLQLNDAQAGAFFLAQFSGSICGTLASTPLAARSGFVRTTVVGLFLMMAGLPGLNFHSYLLCWTAIFVYGIGLGITIPSINLLTIEITPPEKQSSSVNLVNFAWGVGAICSQPFVASVSGGESLVVVTMFLFAALVLLAICFVTARHVVPLPLPRIAGEISTSIWRQPFSWLFLFFGFFVIGIEAGLGGWLTTYSQTIDGGISRINATVLFFACMVFGRGLASIVSRYLSENVLISICAVILLAGISLIVLGETFAMIGAAVAGFGTSAIFPTNMVRFTKIFGPTATKSAAPLFIAGIVGAASLSSLTGIISTAYGSLRIGIVVFLVAAVVVLILQVMIATAGRKRI